MCEVVDISDDEDCSASENVGIKPKDEWLSYDLPSQNACSRSGVHENIASSSAGDLRSSFIGMGFSPSLVEKAIAEKGEGNAELVLETLFAYSDLQQPKTEFFDDGLFDKSNDADPHVGEAFPESLDILSVEDTNKNADCDGNFPLKEERDVGSGIGDDKVASLLKMNFSSDEVAFAMERLGQHASIGKLMDFIFAARMAKKYEKETDNPFPGGEESGKQGPEILKAALSSSLEYSNEALFGIMEKTLQLLEMGFSENEISTAFEICGSEAPLPELAEYIVAPGSRPIANKQYSSASFTNSIRQTNHRPLKRKSGDCSTIQPFDPLYIKTEYSVDVVPQVGPSDLLERSKGKMPKEEEDMDEPNFWKEPKEEEFMEDSSDYIGQMWVESRKGISTSTSNRESASRRRTGILEDRRPSMSLPNPCKSLNSVVAKPPYFLYGNTTNLSHDSWVKISQFLYSLQPELVSTESYSALSRKEGYVHNLPTEGRSHIFPKGPMTLKEAIPHGRKWWPFWDERKHIRHINCETSGTSLLCDRFGRMLAESRGLPLAEKQRDLIRQCEAKSLVWVGQNKLAQLEPEHLERIMGYPVNHSQVGGFSSSERLKSLKLAFQTDTLGYHLSVLRGLFPEGVSVLSFFSGIGGAEVALHRLGIRLNGVVSVEPCETKRRIMKNWWESTAQSGDLIQIEDIHKLSSKKLEDLIKKFRGFDIVVCQNPYSNGDSDSLSGLDFSLFVEFVRVLQRVRSTMQTSR